METEPHGNDTAQRLNWLRAGVLGANDGIVSVAAIVVGVAGATAGSGPILAAGAAGLVGGAVSMALGEYEELTAHDALAAHLSAELNIDETDIVKPWHAAFASAMAFVIGAVLPMLANLLPPPEVRVPLTFAAVLVALALTGALGAWIGGGSKSRAAFRVVAGGALAPAATFSIGSTLGATGVVWRPPPPGQHGRCP